MRYRTEHKAETHQKIVKDASWTDSLARDDWRRGRGSDAGRGPDARRILQTLGKQRDDLIQEALSQAFEDIGDRLVHVAEQSKRDPAWKAIVKAPEPGIL